MKNILLFAMVVLLALPYPSAISEPENEKTGFILGFTDDGFTMKSGDCVFFIATPEETDWDTERPRAGDYVTVRYRGQWGCEDIIADVVSCHMLTGEVTGVFMEPEPYFLMKTESGDTVRVNLGFISPETVVSGLPVTVYYNGIMTRSVPPQVSAEHIRGLTITGEIAEVREDSLLLTGDSPALIRITPETILLSPMMPGSVITVSVLPVMTLSIPPQYTAAELLPAG